MTVIIERLQTGRDFLGRTNSGGVVGLDNLNYENTDKNCRPNNKTGLSFLKLSNLHLCRFFSKGNNYKFFKNVFFTVFDSKIHVSSSV